MQQQEMKRQYFKRCFVDFPPVLGLFGTPLVQAVRNQSKQFSVPSVGRSWLVGWRMFSDGFQPSLSPSTAIYDEC